MSLSVSALAIADLLAYLASQPGGAVHVATARSLIQQNQELVDRVERSKKVSRKSSKKYSNKVREGRRYDVRVDVRPDVTSSVSSDVTATSAGPNSDQGSPPDQGSTDQFRSGEIYPFPERARGADVRGKATGPIRSGEVQDLYELGWQDHFPNLTSAVRPRTSGAAFEDAAHKINDQARRDGIEPRELARRLLGTDGAFWKSEAAERCAYAPGAIASCFPQLISPDRFAKRGPRKLEEPVRVYRDDDPDAIDWFGGRDGGDSHG